MLYLLSVIPGYNYTREFWLPISRYNYHSSPASQTVITVDQIATVAVVTSVNIESHLTEDYQMRTAE